MKAPELALELLIVEQVRDLPIDTANFLPFLAFGPLLKAPLVNVVPAGDLAPHNFLGS